MAHLKFFSSSFFFSLERKKECAAHLRSLLLIQKHLRIKTLFANLLSFVTKESFSRCTNAKVEEELHETRRRYKARIFLVQSITIEINIYLDQEASISLRDSNNFTSFKLYGFTNLLPLFCNSSSYRIIVTCEISLKSFIYFIVELVRDL